MNKFVKILLSCVCAFVVLHICSFLIVLIGIQDFIIIKYVNAGIAISAAVCMYKFLKKKFPEKEKAVTEKKDVNNYCINKDVVLKTPDGYVYGFVLAEEDENGNIRVHTHQPYNGEYDHLFTREELDRLTKGNEK